MPVAKKQKRRIIGVFHGSSPTKPASLRKGLERLKELGLSTKLPADTRRYATKPESRIRKYLAGPDDAKIRSFVRLWNDPTVGTLLAVRGGYGTMRLLSKLENAGLKKTANADRAVWGFSDLTSLQNWIYGRFGIPWVHSPMLSSDSFRAPNALERRAWKACTEGAPFSEYRVKVAHRPKKSPRRVEGPMIGGNLACFVSLLGTRWEPRMRSPFFYFLEEVSEPAYRIDRWLHQLMGSPSWKFCRGVILGHFTECPGALPVVRAWAKENKVLLLEGLPAGHDTPNVPITMGKKVRLEFQKNDVARLRIPNLKFG
jgi:muramoyltetrapeptide carboxypeptidase